MSIGADGVSGASAKGVLPSGLVLLRVSVRRGHVLRSFVQAGSVLTRP